MGLLMVKDNSAERLYTGYRTSAAAAIIAIYRLRREGILTILYDECDENLASGYAVDLINNYKVDVIIGPTCNDPAVAVSVLAAYYNIPVLIWGSVNAGVMLDPGRFKTTATLSTTSTYLATAIYNLCLQFGWNQFVFLYNQLGDNGKCNSMQADFLASLDLTNILNQRNDVDLAYSLELIDLSTDPLTTALQSVISRGRIFVMCTADDSVRLRIMAMISDLGMDTNEYVYIFADTRSKGFSSLQGGKEIYVWETSNETQSASELEQSKKVFRNAIFVIDMMGQGTVAENYSVFGNEVIERMNEPPFSCNADCSQSVYRYAAQYAGQLHDAVYAYGVALNKSIAQNPSVSGPVTIDEDLSRNPTLYLQILNELDEPEIFASINLGFDSVNFTPLYKDENAELWRNWGGQRPRSVPLCGFTGTLCPVDFVSAYLGFVVAGAAVIVIALLAGLYGIYASIRAKHREEERLDSLWKVPHASLKQTNKKGKAENSMRSFSSGPSSTSTKREPVVAMKHQSRIVLTEAERKEMRSLKSLENDNLCRFIGLSLDAPQMLSIWRYCSRGSLADVIKKQNLQMDNFFIYALMKDVVTGLAYIHGSFLQFHGHLTSEFCLIDDRWQIKLAYHGPKSLRNSDKYIVKEIIYLLKKGGMNPIRPSLITSEQIEINPAFLHLIRDCWTERPSERPTIDMVRNSLRSMNTESRSDNLMDHVFTMMESYATVLEEEVDSRTKELVEEKKKSDLLLYRMLPKQVAEKLKLGQPVEPETFESVTLFFSDVVSFTKLAAKCTPLQVVNLLNDLYTLFDGIIDQHDVYKVETIGDGYLCVSGLPHRNGNEHARHVALMSLQLIRELVDFRVPHLPTERINIRIGIHCGSVVSGVVGLTMPRYCLFGDAVNTASRMESNGKPGQIHLSAEANYMLTQIVKGFITESRGDVIIKGKGVMETFWLKGVDHDAGANQYLPRSIIKSNVFEVKEQPTKPESAQRSVTPDSEKGLYMDYKEKAAITQQRPGRGMMS
ncbi:hypothetical protein WR25_06164 [Diploscapter pachys]|uniref:Guanylate cyclase n=1 Tax=Diploscapter pachys TaxID=2018661 RepID=A0A2A2LTI5_9BILA|nr:hypothetical protein WR25_06164 [Diploscapter pachys]